MLNDGAKKRGVAAIYGAISRFAEQMVNRRSSPPNTPAYRAPA